MTTPRERIKQRLAKPIQYTVGRMPAHIQRDDDIRALLADLDTLQAEVDRLRGVVAAVAKLVEGVEWRQPQTSSTGLNAVYGKIPDEEGLCD